MACERFSAESALSALSVLAFYQKRIALPLFSNRSDRTVTGDDDRLVRQREYAIVQRGDDLVERAAGQVSSSNTAREERVAGDQLSLSREVDADATFSMPGRVHHETVKISTLNGIVISEALIDLNSSRRFRSDPSRLHVQHFQECVIVLVQQDGSASRLLEFHRAANVVDVRVRNDDLFELELVLIEDGDDSLDLIAGIDHQSFA